MLLALTGCKEDPPDVGPDLGTKVDPVEFREKAHREAMMRTGDLAQGVFALEDPVGAAMVGLGSLTPPPVSAGSVAALRDGHTEAWREAKDVDGEILGNTERAFLRAMRFGLDRVHDRVQANRPERSDPTWYPTEVRRYLDALAAAIAFGPCEGCAKGLAALATEIDAATTALGATSRASLKAAAQDWAAVDTELNRLPGRAARPEDAPAKTVDAARAAALRARETLERHARELHRAPSQLWGSKVNPVRGGPPAVLPDRLGPKPLSRRLFVEERLTQSPGEQFEALGPTLARLQALEKGLGKLTPGPAPAKVTPDRCRAAATPILVFAANHPLLRRVKNVNCEGLARLAGERGLNDAELTVFIIEHGVVGPARIARRRAESAPVALLGGRISAHSQRLAQSVAVAMGVKNPEAARLALTRAREAGCLAATALWIHGELGEDAKLRTRLERLCEFRPAGAWIADAQARPRAAVAGFGLWVVGAGPAEMAALDHYWWAPAGLVLDLAMPERFGQPEGQNLDFRLEKIEADPVSKELE